MTVVTVRPDTSITVTGWSVYGGSAGGDYDLALRDDSDSTYIANTTGPAAYAIFGYADPTIPAGARFKTIAVRARCAITGGTRDLTSFLTAGDDDQELVGESSINVTWTTPTTITLISAAAGNPLDTSELRTSHLAASGLNIYELFVDVTYVAQPVVTVSAPTGTVTTTNRPLVAWSNTLDADGGAQTGYQVKIFTAAQYGAGGFDPDTSTPFDDTGIVGSNGTSATPTLIQPDGTYRAYVRAAQSVNGVAHWSDWAYSGYVVDVDLPAVPDIILTPLDDEGRVEIYVEGNSGAATTQAFEIQRSTDAGVTWEPVRLLAPPYGPGTIDAAGSPLQATVWDYEAPNGAVVSYRARAMHSYSGEFAASDWATTTTTWSSVSWWLKHPLAPEYNVPVEVHSFPSIARAARQGMFQPVGAAFAVFVTDTRASWSGTVTLRLDDADTRAALDELLALGVTILMQGPAADGEPDRYVRVGDHTRARGIDKAFAGARLETIPWTEVSPPTGDIVAWPEAGS